MNTILPYNNYIICQKAVDLIKKDTKIIVYESKENNVFYKILRLSEQVISDGLFEVGDVIICNNAEKIKVDDNEFYIVNSDNVCGKVIDE